jgi:hypothetical protein
MASISASFDRIRYGLRVASSPVQEYRTLPRRTPLSAFNFVVFVMPPPGGFLDFPRSSRHTLISTIHVYLADKRNIFKLNEWAQRNQSTVVYVRYLLFKSNMQVYFNTFVGIDAFLLC